jgi:TolB-like protein
MNSRQFPKFVVVLFFMLFIGSAALYAKDDPYKEMAQELSDSAARLTNPKIAIVPFSYVDKRKSAGGAMVAERLMTRLVKIGKYKVIERELLENVMQELHFETTGVVDLETTKKLGKVLGVEAIITGSLMDSGEDNVEANARVIKTETAEVMATASVEIPKDWNDEGGAPVVQQAAPVTQGAAEEAPMMKREEAAQAPVRQTPRRPKIVINGFFDFLYGSGGAKMDLTFKNSSRLIKGSDLGINLNGTAGYRQVKFAGEELTANTPPIGFRLVGFGEHWGGAYEMSYYSYTLAKQKTTVALNGGSAVPFQFLVDDYIKINVLNLLSGDLMFRFAKKSIQPYIGLGIGMTLNFISSPYIYGYNSGVYSSSTSEADIGFLFRVPIGLRVNFGDNGSAFVEYRPTTNYIAFDRGGVAGDADEASMSFDFLMFGLGYKFN